MYWMSNRGPKQKATDADIVEAVKQVIRETDAPVAKTAEIAEAVSVIGVQACRDRLREMEDEGLVASKKSGSGKVWWVA